mmetsp:Transcript_59737/g.192248  ORF Transcript_59737/g.192248 Transcript_59737/m.192248 type:complete len:236 (-) Transcript_59737:1347-2054(-)
MPPAPKLHQPVHQHKVVVGLGVRHCGVLPLVLCIHVGAHFEQQHRSLHVAPRGSDVDGRAPLAVSAVDLRAPLQQAANRINVVASRRDMQGSPARCICRVHLHTVGVKKLHEVVALVPGDNVEGRVTLPGLRRQIGSAAIAELCKAHVAGLACVLQQRLVSLDIVGIDLRRLQQPLKHIHQDCPVSGHDLLEVEGPLLLPRRLKRCLEVGEGVHQLCPGPLCHLLAGPAPRLCGR